MSRKVDDAARSDLMAQSLSQAPNPFAGGTRRAPSREAGKSRDRNAHLIDVDRLMPDPDQPRKEFDEDAIDRMARSLADRGQLQPIRVRYSEEAGMWVIISGERRWRGAARAGIKELGAVVVEADAPRAETLLDQVVENVQREDLSPLDRAHAFKELMDLQGWNCKELARKVGVSSPVVFEAMALLKSPPYLQDAVHHGEMSQSVAYELTKVEDPDERAELAGAIVDGTIEGRDEVRARVKRANASSKGRGGKGRRRPSRVLKPWKFKGTAGGRLVVEFSKGLDAAAGLAVIDQARAKYLEDHPELAQAGGDRTPIAAA